MAENYLLRVTAGPDYDESTHVVLPVNTETPTTITSAHCTTKVTVRVQNYRGTCSPDASSHRSNLTGGQASLATLPRPRRISRFQRTRTTCTR
jgi:hypothetical protein